VDGVEILEVTGLNSLRAGLAEITRFGIYQSNSNGLTVYGDDFKIFEGAI